jgi:hypothetical protein
MPVARLGVEDEDEDDVAGKKDVAGFHHAPFGPSGCICLKRNICEKIIVGLGALGLKNL